MFMYCGALVKSFFVAPCRSKLYGAPNKIIIIFIITIIIFIIIIIVLLKVLVF